MKHFEWTLVLLLVVYILIDVQVTAIAILLVGIGSQLPDILEILIRVFFNKNQKFRAFSHSFLFPMLIIVLSWYIEDNQFGAILFYLGFSMGSHLLIDAYSGCEGIYLLYPINSTFELRAITKNRRKKIGKVIQSKFGHLVATETNPDLAWFWLLQFIAVILVMITITIYIA